MSIHFISIHAFRVEGDFQLVHTCFDNSYFNPRLPCGRRRCKRHALYKPCNFNPRLPCGRRHNAWTECFRLAAISIHAFRVEGDLINENLLNIPTSISIHAFRVEGDERRILRTNRPQNFNPRLPCGRRPSVVAKPLPSLQFQSTPSVWKATVIVAILTLPQAISIHAFRVEGDCKS